MSYPLSDTFTVTQAVNALGFGWFQVKLSLCTGLCWMADSMEMTILSILSPALHCEWNISKYVFYIILKHFSISGLAFNMCINTSIIYIYNII